MLTGRQILADFENLAVDRIAYMRAAANRYPLVQKSAMLNAVSRLMSGHAIGNTSVP